LRNAPRLALSRSFLLNLLAISGNRPRLYRPAGPGTEPRLHLVVLAEQREASTHATIESTRNQQRLFPEQTDDRLSVGGVHLPDANGLVARSAVEGKRVYSKGIASSFFPGP
jgi:hypothetical protein